MRAGETKEAIGKTINLGSGREISIGDLANMIAKLVGTSIHISSDDQRIRPEGSEVERLLADNTLAQKLLGWEPQVSLEVGLERTIAWIKDHPEGYRPDIYNL
jgi:nucleoside-diphosphate-sugar epimerase